MKKLTLVIDDFGMDELKDYLSSLKGVISASVKNDKCIIIDVCYDEKLLTDDIIYLEILAFLDIPKLPSLVSFDKHSKKETKTYKIESNMCCEYCFKIAVDDLFNTKGILKVDSNYIEQYCERQWDERGKDSLIIYYDPKLIDNIEKVVKDLDI